VTDDHRSVLGGNPHGRVLPDSALVATPWSVGSSLGLVAVALALTLLAGAVVAQIAATGWAPIIRTFAAGGVLLGVYAALLGIVWGASGTLGVRFADEVGLARAAGPRWYAAAMAAAVVGWLFSAGYVSALTAFGLKLPREDLAAFRLLPGGPVGTVVTVALLVVVAPLAEEVIYRGVLLPSLANRWGWVSGLAISSTVFSAAHVSWVGFLPLLVTGAVFGWLFAKSQSLWVAVAAHAAYNALGVFALLASKSSGVL
jgi:membrane protease YdiL (CAAX protease family)